MRPCPSGILAILFSLAQLHLAASAAVAMPVAPLTIALSQPDGTTFEAVPFGDEWANGYETDSGFTILRDATTGFWHYATRSPTGHVVPSNLRLGRDVPTGIVPHLRDDMPIVPRGPAAYGGLLESGGNVGRHQTLVVLARFSDQDSVGSSPARWAGAIFGSANSASHYFREVSYGLLSIYPVSENYGTPDDGVVGWISLPYPHPNTRGSVDDRNRQIVRDAIIAADPFVDFASLDVDGNGVVKPNELHIVVVVAGYETSYGGAAAACSPSVWAHNGWLGDSVPLVVADGRLVGARYVEVGEWDCASFDEPGHAGTIGTTVHELGHDLGWPDLYDTDQSSEGVGYWSVMGLGGWLATTGPLGSLPGHPDAFSKWHQGWLTPYQVSGQQVGVQIQPAETSPRVIQLLDNPGGVDWRWENTSGVGEYFLIENRQQVGYDAGLPGCGLLIWHVDETRSPTSAANAVDSRRLVDLEEADGQRHLDFRVGHGDAGDPYPGTTNNRSFDESSNPDSRRYGGTSSGASVTSISPGCYGAVTADFVAPAGGLTPTPTNVPTPSSTHAPTATSTPTNTPVAPASSTPTPTPTSTPTRTSTPVNVNLPTETSTPISTPAATLTPTPAAPLIYRAYFPVR
ncbi:MAG: M6 family metalloprotease domain-containing protein [Chloroflexi bacterium]|nr:M6 family metalloprotease domain-containing protein [Chloroflexota bacterium]